MSILGKFLGTDKAIEGVTKVTAQALTMWDNKDFTPQERIAAFESISKAMNSKETSISRRIIIWALTGIISLAFAIGVIWISFDADSNVKDMILLIQALKIDWAFAGGIAFYFLTHVTRGSK